MEFRNVIIFFGLLFVVITVVILFLSMCKVASDADEQMPDMIDQYIQARENATKTINARKDISMKIKIKYFDKEIDKIEKINKGDWVDLRSAETINLKKGEFHLIPLGVGMKLPDGYEANIVPRSSTYKHFKILQTNSFAVIDNSYSGDNDQWFYPVIAMEDTTIKKNDRICQFRINKIQPTVEFEEVEKLEDKDRGGIGSTGVA